MAGLQEKHMTHLIRSILVVVMLSGFDVALATAVSIRVHWDGQGDYRTIQAGIDAASDGDEVVVSDGTYTGVGNRDLNFHGKTITVRSENGPAHCIIDCGHAGRGFTFQSGETEQAVVDGFTILVLLRKSC